MFFTFLGKTNVGSTNKRCTRVRLETHPNLNQSASVLLDSFPLSERKGTKIDVQMGNILVQKPLRFSEIQAELANLPILPN